MRQVPREQFVEPGFEEFAYEDGALPIANEQTISQPYIVALMTEAAELKSTDKVLEVGTGSGCAAAIASQLAKTVHTIERHGDLARIAAQRLTGLGCMNCVVHTGDGTRGLADEAPFDAILVTAGGSDALKQEKRRRRNRSVVRPRYIGFESPRACAGRSLAGVAPLHAYQGQRWREICGAAGERASAPTATFCALT
jgi:Protein-L-isoaspartate(D-aspartate) O-methyltransferase (PCMT)